jgi:hypothetical protein
MTAQLTQLTIDGGEVPYPPPRPRPLTASQREIIRWTKAHGEIRSSEAGSAVHAWRTRGTCGRPLAIECLGCCEHAASDGYGACKRLERRGLLRHAGRGRWVLADGD